MSAQEYSAGDYLFIRDAQKAAQRIAMQAELEEGLLVKVQQTRGEMLICEPAELDTDGEIEVQLFPSSAGKSFTLQGGAGAEQVEAESRLIEDDVAADVSEYLTSSQDIESRTRK